MDYQKIYSRLVESRRHRGTKKEAGYEVHHIVPRCLGGTDGASNLVKFTVREHYIAHWLLCKMYPMEAKIQYTFWCFMRDPHGHRKLTSRMVETIKEHYSEFRSWQNKINNPGRSENSRAKARARMSGEGNPMRGKPEKNPTARPHRVIFEDGTERVYAYGRLGYEDLGIARSTWILAVRTGNPIPSYKIKQVIKEINKDECKENQIDF